ncbi:MAG TPA: HD domain-containing protein [Chitinophagaceae bacterium]|jgi:(p)ppGpp synthase/HD superfamily hydrolase|nr:HD domain-containing protein [Chitinophagaceae bacterium]
MEKTDWDLVLRQVRDWADRAHGTQMRKYTPERYIVHPVRVMECCSRYTSEQPVLAAALLHDVLEDTPETAEGLQAFLVTVMPNADAQRTLQLTVELTDVYVKAAYPYWNRRKRKLREGDRLVRASPEAHTIKYADILDNSLEIADQDPAFATRYLREALELLERLRKGHPDLRQLALDTVRSRLKR